MQIQFAVAMLHAPAASNIGHLNAQVQSVIPINLNCVGCTVCR